MIKHTVQQGESLYSIARLHRFNWETLWSHEGNAKLQQLRKNPEVLEPGDQIEIPDKTIKNLDCNTENKHRFRLHGVPCYFRLQLEIGDKVRTSLPFELRIGLWSSSGKTNNAGMIELVIPPDSSKGVLITRGPEGEQEWPLLFGHLNPADTVFGAMARLVNLGYASVEESDADEERLEQILKGFQVDQGLQVNGNLDQLTVSALTERHGS